MYIQPLQAVESPGCYHVGGDVTIHPSATIAPGALIRAEPNCRIEIGPAACLGMGVVLHACEGNIKIEAGVSLGAAVLIVGRAEIGANASIGSSTTLRNCTVASYAIVPSASLMGEVESHPAGAIGSSTSANRSSTADERSTGNMHRPVNTSNPEVDASDGYGSSNDSPANVGNDISGTTSPSGAGDDRNSAEVAAYPPPVNRQVNGHSAPRDEALPLDGDASIHNGFPPSSASHRQAPAQANSRPLVSGPPIESSEILTNKPATVADFDGNQNNLVSSVNSASNGHAQQSTTLGEPALSQQSLLAPQSQTPKPSPAFGKSQVNRLMKSLFPYSQTYTSQASTNGHSSEATTALSDAAASDSIAADSIATEGVTSDPKL
ncbi:MAG: hypothetical protein AAF974_02685 [Cyanobacteria bacterium P01_E01_bin.34]